MSPHRKPRTRVTVTAVDDHPIVVEGLASLMSRAPRADWLDGLVAATRENSPELVWLGQSKTLADLLQRLEEWETPPDVVLYDLFLNDGSDPADGIAVLAAKGVRVVILTSEVRPVPIRRAIQAGATGLVLKSDDVEKILDVVRAAALGHFAVSSDLAFVLATDDTLAPHLAPRELEVLQLLAEGVARKSVGNRLDPPGKLATVVTYLNRICKRYQDMGRDVKTTQDAIRAAVENGYFDMPGSPGPQ